MAEKNEKQKEKKGFFSKLAEKIDKKMSEKAKDSPCCGGDDKDDKKGGSCCG